jgi:hypothetical protein
LTATSAGGCVVIRIGSRTLTESGLLATRPLAPETATSYLPECVASTEGISNRERTAPETFAPLKRH